MKVSKCTGTLTTNVLQIKVHYLIMCVATLLDMLANLSNQEYSISHNSASQSLTYASIFFFFAFYPIFFPYFNHLIS